MRLNLGCSDDAKPGFLGVDVCAPANIICDLREKWPWKDSSVDEIFAHDVFEHLDTPEFRGNRGKIWAMNEAWRVLKPGGKLDLAVPCAILLDGRMNPGAFADPTHVSFWTGDDRYYFCEEWNHPKGERGRLGPAYGIKALFQEISWKVIPYGKGAEERAKLMAILKAVK